ncbi:MAG TPA: DUF58 domain-containing protein [Candidatus Eisenbacteria bacterium]|nr:DUF58 domain-containing protein [Candidatus Eisenbacteria bacterium]
MIPRDVLRKVRHIEIRTRRLVNDMFGGEYHSVFKGLGMEFAEVREYAAGDDIRSIDWNVTARLGHPFVKLYREERELTVVLLVDQSASGFFGTHHRLKSELAAEVGALLALSAVENNDRVGLILFSDRVELTVPPAKGRRHVLRVVREILAHEPEGRGTNLAAALDHLSRLQKRRAVVFLLSDFLATNYETSFAIASRRHDLVALRLRDRREEILPSVGLVALRDLESGRPLVVDTSDRNVRRRFSQQVVERERAFVRAVRHARVDAVDLWTGEDVVAPLAGFFRKRMRRR